MKSPKWNQILLVFAVIANSQKIGKEIGTNKHFRCPQPSNQLFQHPPNSQWLGSKELQGLFPVLPLNWLGETSLQTGDKALPVRMDNRATLLVLNPTTIKPSLLPSTKIVQIVGISNKPQEDPVSEIISFCLGPLEDTHPFLLCPCPLIRSRLLREILCWNKIILEINVTNQVN